MNKLGASILVGASLMLAGCDYERLLATKRKLGEIPNGVVVTSDTRGVIISVPSGLIKAGDLAELGIMPDKVEAGWWFIIGRAVARDTDDFVIRVRLEDDWVKAIVLPPGFCAGVEVTMINSYINALAASKIDVANGRSVMSEPWRAPSNALGGTNEVISRLGRPEARQSVGINRERMAWRWELGSRKLPVALEATCRVAPARILYFNITTSYYIVRVAGDAIDVVAFPRLYNGERVIKSDGEK